MQIRSAKVLATAAAVLLLGAISAQGSEAILVGDRAGFLFGHAHRCGIEDARLQRLEPVISAAISSFAVDEEDKQAAVSAFARRFLASALAQLSQDPLPFCGTVRSQLARLEQHRATTLAQSGRQGEAAMTRDNQPKITKGASPRADATTKRAKARKQISVRTEGLTPERRAELELKRVARELRGRPPSI